MPRFALLVLVSGLFAASVAGIAFADQLDTGPVPVATANPAGTPPPNPTTVEVPVLSPPPAITGTIDQTWSKAAQIALLTDFTYRRAAEQPTQVYVGQDSSALYVAFVVTQPQAITAQQQTNGSAVTSDDYVGVYLWPQGTQGFSYFFGANPRGTRYQSSSENSAYTPQWSATGERSATGYVVTMRIPLGVIRSGGSHAWRAQFVRETVATNGLSVWTFSERQQNANDPAFAGTLLQVGVSGVTANRPRPRAQVYGLGELTTPANGGSTSRIGADFSLPVTPTASFVGTIHPDYSNVEVDQQTIAPNAFAYQYQEVRPFFTQAAQAFNYNLSCSNCPLLLYTPAIPTFRDGFALEGTQGHFTFSGFDAIGYGRVDEAQALDYGVETQENVYSFNLQHIEVNETGGFNDDLMTMTGGVLNQHTHFFLYANAAADRGTNVTSPGDGNYAEGGVGYASATAVAVANYQTFGPQFAPLDSYVAQSGITGDEFYARKLLKFSPGAPLHDIQAQTFYAWYHDPFGGPGQVDASEDVFFDFRDLLTLRLFASTSAVKVLDGEFIPFDGNEVYLGYRVATNTPTYLQYAGGPYYHGKLDSWSYVTTLPVLHKVNLRFEADENNYLSTYPGEIGGAQWLERATLDWQISRDASFDLGVRRIIGRTLPNAFMVPTFQYIDAGNVSFAFHFLAAKNEFYFVYGDPNSLATTPKLYLKLIRYIGAPKGT